MMSVTQVATALQAVLVTVPAACERVTGFCQRRSKLSGAAFVQTTVLGWLAHPAGSLTDLTTVAADRGVTISPQGLDQRFTPAAVALLEDVLRAAVAQVVVADPVALPVLRRFAAVEIIDSTTITLPDALAPRWASCGGRTATTPTAAVKATVRLELTRGQRLGPELTAGRTQDRATALQHAPLRPGALRIGDLGFWSLRVLAEIRAQEAHFLSRLHVQTVVQCADDGHRLDLGQWLAEQGAAVHDLAVLLGQGERIPARLVAVRVPPPLAADRRQSIRARARQKGVRLSARNLERADWTLLVTSVPAALLSADEVVALYRARWQIELLFKRWKTQGKLAIWRSRNPSRILCELYAKLIALVLQQWLTLIGGGDRPDYSRDRAAAAIRSHVPLLAVVLSCPVALRSALRTLQRVLATGPPITKRRTHPATFQRLLCSAPSA